MRTRYRLIIFLLSVGLSQGLFSWGLLQGRVKSAYGTEKDQYIKGLYKVYDPFYTGPLLAPSAHTVPKGHVNIQPYYFWKKNYGRYDSSWHRVRTRNNLQFQFLSVLQYGLTDFMDFTTTVQAFLNRKESQHFFGYGDTTISFGFQMLEGIVGTPVPSCTIQVSETFPSGRYQHLNRRKLGTDAQGSGAYGTGFSLNFQKDFNSIFRKDLDPEHFHPFRIRWNFAYTINSRTHVEGINSYGGNQNTFGRVRVGNNFTSIFAWEFSFTKRWVFATDWQYTVSSPSKFSGNDGGESVGGGGNQNWSVAPAIEFSINERGGILAGAWFSFAGRNSDSFVAGLVSFTILF